MIHARRRAAGIRDAAVVAETFDSNARLSAFVTTDSAALDSGTLRAELANLLPEYLIPSRFFILDSLPLTTSGKLDRGTLPKPAPQVEAPAPTWPPARTNLERVRRGIGLIASHTLGQATIPGDTGLFELGAN